MKKSKVLAAILSGAVLIASSAFALDSEMVRNIKRADDVKELVELADEIMKDAAPLIAPEPDKAAEMMNDANLYLMYIKIKLDEVAAKEAQSRHKELLGALGKK